MTSEKSTYKNLNLDREKLSEFIKQFYQENGLKELERTPSEWGPDDKLRVIRFGRTGSKPAQVNLYLNQDGSTSISYKTGKNYDLGECLAVYLKETINPDEFERVEMSLNSIPAGDYAVLLACLKEEGYETVNSDIPGGKKQISDHFYTRISCLYAIFQNHLPSGFKVALFLATGQLSITLQNF